MTEVEDVLNMIKSYWPQFQISKKDLLHPTPELAVRFYSSFVTDANEKVAYLVGCVESNDTNKMELSLEDRLFQEVSKLLKNISSLTFTLGDIYLPTAIRAKNFFKICTHFLTFIDQNLNEFDMLGNGIFKAKQEANKLVLEQQELLHSINENAKLIAEMAEFNENVLKQEYKSTKNAHKEMIDLRTSKEKLHAEKRRKIDQLKQELQNKEYELNRLESGRKILLEQKQTEGEYQTILRTLENLKRESETLDSNDMNMGEGLDYENDILKHCADCIGELSKCSFNLQNVKKLIHQEEEIKNLSNMLEDLQNSKLNLLKEQRLESEKNLSTIKEYFTDLQNELKKVEDHNANGLQEMSAELENIKQITAEKSQNNLQIIADYKKQIRELMENMEKLKKASASEYFRVHIVEQRVVNNFSKTLNKFREL